MRIHMAVLLSVTALLMAFGVGALPEYHAHRRQARAHLEHHAHKQHLAQAPIETSLAATLEQVFDLDLDHAPQALADAAPAPHSPARPITPFKSTQSVIASKRTFDATVQLLL